MSITNKKCIFTIAVLNSLISYPVFAETCLTPCFNSPCINALTHGHFVFTLGNYQGTQGNSQHINIQDLIGDTFTVDNRQYNNYLMGIGYFIDGKSYGCFNLSYGINAFYLAPTAVFGNVIQEDLFTNLSYHYNIANYPVYIMAKSSYYIRPCVALTFDIGAGPNFIKTYDFQETSLDAGFTQPDNIFSANTTTSLSATLGVGFKLDQALGQIPLEVGYRFFYLGQGHFKKSNDQILNELNTGKMYANSLYISISI